MSFDFSGIDNVKEYYSTFYFTEIFETDAKKLIDEWKKPVQSVDKPPWALLRELGDSYLESREVDRLADGGTGRSGANDLADGLLRALGYPGPRPAAPALYGESPLRVPVKLEINNPDGSPLLWVMLARSDDGGGLLQGRCLGSDEPIGDPPAKIDDLEIGNDVLFDRIFFARIESPRWLVVVGDDEVLLLDRLKWNQGSHLRFNLSDIFERRQESTLQAMSVLLHRNSVCPESGVSKHDEFRESSTRHAVGVTEDLKFAMREATELLGNEVLHDLRNNEGPDASLDPEELTLQCLRWMYRLLSVFFIEASPSLGYAPMGADSYFKAYSLETVRDIAADC